MKKVVRLFRKIGIAFAGFSVLLAGVIMLVLPGPGILVIIAGLAILAIEFEWAEHHLNRSREAIKKVGKKAKEKTK
jgi:uncharacterized protein (TIGR02611 family)